MTRTVRVGDEYELPPLEIDGKEMVGRVSVQSRKGDRATALPDPYRGMVTYPMVSRTPVSVCHTIGDNVAAPLVLAEPGGSCMAMIASDDPALLEALRDPSVRRSEDLLAVVDVHRGRIEHPGQAEGALVYAGPFAFDTLDRDGQPMHLVVLDVAAVRIEWDKRSGRAVVDLGRGRSVEVEALGYGLISDDKGATRRTLEEFVKARSPAYRRAPAVHQALTRSMVPLRRSESDREILKDYIEVRETSIVDDRVTKVEVSMELGEEARQRLYGARVRRSTPRSRSVKATMPLPFDQVKYVAHVTPEDIAALHEVCEGNAESPGSVTNLILRKVASRVFIGLDTLMLRTYCAIVSECQGDAMEWVENPAQICRALGASTKGKESMRIRQRIEDLKRTNIVVCVASDSEMRRRELPLFAASGTVSSVDLRTGEGKRARPVWHLHPHIVAWMNSDGGHFAYLDPMALRLGDLESEWEFRAYIVLCDRWASGLVTHRRDPDRAERIKASSLLDVAGVDWRNRYGYAVSKGRDAPGSRRRPKEFAERFDAMVGRLVDSGLVGFAERETAADDPVDTVWRFVPPMALRHKLDENSSKRLTRQAIRDRARLAN